MDTRPGRRGMTRFGGALALVAATFLVACAPSDPPPTNPLSDDSSPGTVTGTQSPLPTFPATSTAEVPAGSTPPADLEAEQERVVGEAISRIAEWLGEPETAFELVSIEAVDWSSACLGVQVPGIACAEVVTPGYLVQVAHNRRPSLPYQVHTSRDGDYAWGSGTNPPSSERTIERVDIQQGLVILESIGGNEDFIGTQQRVVPGSYLEVPLAELQPGQRVEIATAPGILTDTRDTSVIVWLTPTD